MDRNEHDLFCALNVDPDTFVRPDSGYNNTRYNHILIIFKYLILGLIFI